MSQRITSIYRLRSSTQLLQTIIEDVQLPLARQALGLGGSAASGLTWVQIPTHGSKVDTNIIPIHMFRV